MIKSRILLKIEISRSCLLHMISQLCLSSWWITLTWSLAYLFVCMLVSFHFNVHLEQVFSGLCLKSKHLCTLAIWWFSALLMGPSAVLLTQIRPLFWAATENQKTSRLPSSSPKSDWAYAAPRNDTLTWNQICAPHRQANKLNKVKSEVCSWLLQPLIFLLARTTDLLHMWLLLL